MAVLTLHPPRTIPSDAANLCNYINLMTERVGLFPEASPRAIARRLARVTAKAPNGAVLATGVDHPLKVSMAVVGDLPSEPSPTSGSFRPRRTAFDKITYEDVAFGTSVKDLDFSTVNLAHPGFDIYPGAILVLRFKDPARGRRYFRVLIHPMRDFGSGGSHSAFGGHITTLQFEELLPNRIMVPLAIDVNAAVGEKIRTSWEIPAHFISGKTRQIAWSLRPRGGLFIGPDYYDKSFPMVKVDIELRTSPPGATEETTELLERPPLWSGLSTQRHMASRSYLNSTYAIEIYPDGRLQKEPGISEMRPEYQPPANDREVWTHSYKYTLYVFDGDTMQVEPYDPPMDVEDEM